MPSSMAITTINRHVEGGDGPKIRLRDHADIVLMAKVRAMSIIQEEAERWCTIIVVTTVFNGAVEPHWDLK